MLSDSVGVGLSKLFVILVETVEVSVYISVAGECRRLYIGGFERV